MGSEKEQQSPRSRIKADDLVWGNSLLAKWGITHKVMCSLVEYGGLPGYSLKDLRNGKYYGQRLNQLPHDVDIVFYKKADVEKFEAEQSELLKICKEVSRPKGEPIFLRLASKCSGLLRPKPKKNPYVSELEDRLAEALAEVSRQEEDSLKTERVLHEALLERDAHIIKLEAELSAVKLERGPEAMGGEICTIQRTQAATEARQEKRLKEWQEAFKVMVRVVFQCAIDGPKKRTRRDFRIMSARQGIELTTTQLDFLRECLPDEHVNKNGGPSVQSE